MLNTQIRGYNLYFSNKKEIAVMEEKENDHPNPQPTLVLQVLFIIKLSSPELYSFVPLSLLSLFHYWPQQAAVFIEKL